MSTKWETYPIKLTGGLVTHLGRLEQGIQLPGSATTLQNFEASVDGGYTRILGYQKFSPIAVPATGLVHGVIAISEGEVLAQRGGAFYYSTGAGWTNKLTLPTTTVTQINSAPFNFTGVKKYVVVDGVNAPAIFDTVTKTMAYIPAPSAEVIGASRVEVFQSHLFYAKGSTLAFTAPYTEHNFGAGAGAGVIQINDAITGLITFRDQLIIFCLNSIYKLSGNTLSDFVLAPITNGTGCLSGDTVQEVAGDIMYLGPDGVRYLSASEKINDFGLARASERIQSEVVDLVSVSGTYASVTLSSKNQYRLFHYQTSVTQANTKSFIATKFSNQTAEDIAWSLMKGVKVYSCSKFQARQSEHLFFSSDTDYIYRMEAGNSFDGVPIEAIFETPYMPVTDPKMRKTFYKHTVYVKTAGALNVEGRLKFDYKRVAASPDYVFNISSGSSGAVYGDPSTIYGTAVYGAGSVEEVYNNVIGGGFTVAIRYAETSTNPPFNLNFIILEYQQNERR